jgi:two-component system NtrC family sensor kinase
MLQAEKLTSRGKLAAVVAHEINNPLMGILTYARLIRRWLEQDEAPTERVREMLDSLRLIESESRRCGNLVKDLLAFARPTPMNVQKIDINEVIRLCARLVEHKLDLSAISLRLALDESLPRVEVDPAQIQQLFLALILNAIDAMPREGLLQITTRPHHADPDAVEVEIEDNGVGIPEEVRSRLFEPFVTTKEDGRGVGLGLAISRRIIERHSGRIEVESELGQGTTFTIVLPVTLPRHALEPLSEAV